MSDTAFVQRQLNLTPTDQWSPQTEASLRSFQSAAGLFPTGVPDVATLSLMGLYDPVAGAPSEPSEFRRNLSTATNQIPRWAWVLFGVGFGGLAYLSWRRRGKE